MTSGDAANEFGFSCPLPLERRDQIQLAHGGGGRMMRQLIEQLFVDSFRTLGLQAATDSAVLAAPTGRLAFTTDAYVVRPLFFPGGDIGSLAVNGTVNDLAMSGARPLYLSVAFILEEGLRIETLRRVVRSMATAAARSGVAIVTGDTKVVDRGKGDGIYVTTAGVGEIIAAEAPSPSRVRADDVVLVSGDVGRHGIAIMTQREGLEFETTIMSDCASLADLVQRLFAAGVDVHCLRDLTRGGLAAALVEIADVSGLAIQVREADVPVSEPVRAACELLGFDPWHVANEGRFIAIVGRHHAEQALAVLRSHPLGSDARAIGLVRSAPRPRVSQINRLGIERVVDLPSGEQLPRIC